MLDEEEENDGQGTPFMSAMASSKSDSTASDVPSAADQAQKIQQQAPAKVEWLQSVELGYEQKVASGLNPSVCFHCGNSDKKLSKCAKCGVASYCSRDCQTTDWKASGGGHKNSCDGMFSCILLLLCMNEGNI
jgi:hypothetical protein